VEACELLRSVVREHAADETQDGSLLNWLAKAVGAGGGNHHASERLTGDAATVLFGGIETVSSVMAWFFWELSRNPAVAQEVWQEVADVAGKHGINAEDRDSFKWLKAALWETVRLHPGVVFTRQVEHDVTVGGVRLPVGTEVLVSPYAMHRNPGFFSRPDKFDPQRWLDGRDSPGHAYIPFGAGHRKCLGDNQAMAQMALSLATLGLCWRVEVTNTEKVREVVAATTRPDRLDAVAYHR
jgi:cytochrome P450